MKSKRLLAIFAAFTMSAALFAAGCKDTNNEKPDNQNNVSQDGGNTDDGKNNNNNNNNNNNTENNNNDPVEDTSTPFTGKIYLVGDSTVCSFSDDYFLPRYGYGTQLHNYINLANSNQIVNLALSGRSSKSYLTEANYTTLKNSIAEGDYLIIGFGHNDEKSDDAARFTSPNGDYTVSGSFQNVLYENYVKLAGDKGATPILCTPVTRYDASGAYTGSKVHVTSDGDYVQAIKDLGAAKETTVIDLTALTVAEYKKDNTAAAYYHAHTTRKGAPGATVGTEEPDGRDDTHLNEFGAKMVAYKLTQALLATDCPLKNNVKTNSTPPAYETDYAEAINTSYVKPDYKGFDPANTTATKLSDEGYGWFASYMGVTGGSKEDKVGGLKATYSGGKFTVGDTANVKGTKFASNGDGFVAAFTQIPADKNFTASVTVTVTQNGSQDTDKQSGFGMMLRDDILINTEDTTFASNYVAGGVLKNYANIFSRNSNTKINADKTVASSSLKGAVGDSHNITIERLGQIVTVTVDGQSHVYQEDAMDLFARDNGNMYLCLFANRGFVVEFTNLVFTVTGDSQGA